MIVSRFGLHTVPGGIAFLVQANGSQNLISPDLRFPYSIHIKPRTLRCPHFIDLNSGVGIDVPGWVSDPLLRAFLPLPAPQDAPALLVLDQDDRFRHLAPKLARMSSPTGPVAQPAWMLASGDVKNSYSVSNLSPIILTSTEVTGTKDVLRHMDLARANQRQLIVFARERLPLFGADAKWVTPPEYLPVDEPLEAIGAAALRKYMTDEAA